MNIIVHRNDQKEFLDKEANTKDNNNAKNCKLSTPS